ncbi:hypothetical protein [Shewanella ulleungensis]|uniref:Uncharacterized protein n=1 Tax=Shewanella ulleungensis TaxID=2282699 RepID=A0ABQ2QPX3_9GAMM|nr:hypothetical protein [Shewanella ulleungensis]MCL1150464.1 hypothetical protein [Shewanella ulleungensis]GGP87448.1 hypothetical protein GCM10009410_21270 [Shewanella ulleungensis]
MRVTVKYRLVFLVLMVLSFVIGVQWTPETLASDTDKRVLYFISALYFVLLPLSYWYCIIKKGAQKLWKLIVIFSLSSLVARLSFPAEIAHYFEFIAWLRYPIIAVLLVIELYLIVSVVRGLLKVRKLKGDPRVGAVETYREGDDKSLTIALIMASEATNWFYSIPWFSRNHPPVITNINLKSAARWHVLLLITGCIVASCSSYLLLVSWSEWVAIIVSSIIGYTLMSIVANHRLSRYYSLYLMRDNLVINNSLWGFMVVNMADIASVEPQGSSELNKDEPGTILIGCGRGNVTVTLNRPVVYHGGMGQLPEPMTVIHLSVDAPQQLINALNDVKLSQAA